MNANSRLGNFDTDDDEETSRIRSVVTRSYLSSPLYFSFIVRSWRGKCNNSVEHPNGKCQCSQIVSKSIGQRNDQKHRDFNLLIKMSRVSSSVKRERKKQYIQRTTVEDF